MNLTRKLESRGIPWLFALTIAGYPLVSVLPAVGGFPSRWVSIPYRALVLALALAILFLIGIGASRIRVSAAAWVPLGVFWFLYLLRLSTDTVFDPAPLRLSPFEYTLFVLGVTLVPMLAFFVRPDEDTLRRALRRVTVVATLAVAGVLLAGARALLTGGVSAFLVQRFETDALNPTTLGHVGVSLIIVTVFQLLAPTPPRRKAHLFLGAGLGLVALVMSAARAPLLVLAVVLPVLVVLSARRGAQGRAMVLTAVLVATTLGGWVVVRERVGLAAVYRLTALLDPDDPSTSGRLEVMGDAWEQYVGEPVLGAGIEEARSGFYPHNVVLEAFMATGIIGGFALIALLGVGFVAGWRVLFEMPEHGWVALLCLQYVFSGLVAGSLWGSPEMWGYLAAVLALAAPGFRRPREAGSETSRMGSDLVEPAR